MAIEQDVKLELGNVLMGMALGLGTTQQEVYHQAMQGMIKLANEMDSKVKDPSSIEIAILGIGFNRLEQLVRILNTGIQEKLVNKYTTDTVLTNICKAKRKRSKRK